MHQSHGMSYAEYSQDLEKRIDVEKEREREYKQAFRLTGVVRRSA
ncbi:hypothetical protein [Halalkalibacterium halodurans]|nr:hypothetical protein [Halalkalibacterium halodurans]MDY7224000.1 hypothetical protein [Halalkalibacterium halodurans]MDY7243285.1 hypothetical protein [Halalkalibacterium halodurans]